MWRFIFLVPLIGCADETISGYAGRDANYVVASIDGAAFPAHATMRFSTAGQIQGQGPCNSYSAPQTAPYPWFDAGPLISTKLACGDLDQERVFFAALADMSLAEVAGSTLILSNETGREMVLRAQN